MSSNEDGALKLKVAEGLGKDVGRCFARIDPDDIQRLTLAIGDIVQVTGKRTTVCKVMPAYKEQRELSHVQLDNINRENASTKLDKIINVRKVICHPTERIVIAPLN